MGLSFFFYSVTGNIVLLISVSSAIGYVWFLQEFEFHHLHYFCFAVYRFQTAYSWVDIYGITMHFTRLCF